MSQPPASAATKRSSTEPPNAAAHKGGTDSMVKSPLVTALNVEPARSPSTSIQPQSMTGLFSW